LAGVSSGATGGLGNALDSLAQVSRGEVRVTHHHSERFVPQ